MKKVKTHLKIAIVMALSVFLIIGCEKQLKDETSFPEVTPESEPVLKQGDYCVVDLLAGQTIEVGTVTTEFVSSEEVLIIYTITDPEWCIMETHLDVQIDPANFPQTNSGNPKVGQFAYGEILASCESGWSQTIDLNTVQDWDEGDMVYIAAHADVLNQSNEEESAWGEGQTTPGNNWAMYFECVPPPSWECGDPIIDERDGQSYNTVLIGEQCWMAENLNVGIRIDGVENMTENDTIEKYCYNDDPNICNTYGGLYQWNEMMQYTTQQGVKGICPTGWHIPTDDEFNILEGTVDSQYGVGDPEWDGTDWRGLDAGYHLKSTTGWVSNGNGDDSFGFTALPGGHRYYYGGLHDLGNHAYFWSSSGYSGSDAWSRYLGYSSDKVRRYYSNKIYGFSVRCLQD